MDFLLKILITAVGFLVAARIMSGVRIDSFGSALGAAVVLAIANVLVKPLLVFLTIPITFLTLGLFLLVINGVIILLVSAVVPGLKVNGLGAGIGLSIIVWLVSWVGAMIIA